MQTLYTLEAQEQVVKPGEPVKILQKHIDQSRQLLVYLLYIITEVARYAETDSRVRRARSLRRAMTDAVNAAAERTPVTRARCNIGCLSHPYGPRAAEYSGADPLRHCRA